MNKISFEEKKFNIPVLKGISETNISEHLKLYSGYVKSANSILARINELTLENNPDNFYFINELRRRFSFEYSGMINHELYFSSFEKNSDETVGENSVDPDSKLIKLIVEQWGSFENWLNEFKSIGLTKGPGWVILYEIKDGEKVDDKKFNNSVSNNSLLMNSWVDEQHVGHLPQSKILIALDMWEHAFVSDYKPSGKKEYLNDFFSNLNWRTINNRFNS